MHIQNFSKQSDSSKPFPGLENSISNFTTFPRISQNPVWNTGVCLCVCMVSTKFRGQDGQSVALDMKLFELSQVPYLLRQRDQIIVPQTQLDRRKKKKKNRTHSFNTQDLIHTYKQQQCICLKQEDRSNSDWSNIFQLIN